LFLANKVACLLAYLLRHIRNGQNSNQRLVRKLRRSNQQRTELWKLWNSTTTPGKRVFVYQHHYVISRSI